MTRSKKAPIYTCSKPRDETHRRRERHKVKQALHVDIESEIPHLNSKELGNDEWGTKFGFIPEGVDMYTTQEDIDKAKRK